MAVNGSGPARGQGAGQGTGGVPDGLLVSALAFLLGVTFLVWTGTGLAAFFTHGDWPDGVTLLRTPLALRHLMSDPRDLPGAWPDAPKGSLSGYGLFWGITISEALVLTVLAVFAIGTVTRWRRGTKARRASAATEGRASGVAPVAYHGGASGAPSPTESGAVTQGAVSQEPVTQVPGAPVGGAPVGGMPVGDVPPTVTGAPGAPPGAAPGATPGTTPDVRTEAAPRPPAAPAPATPYESAPPATIPAPRSPVAEPRLVYRTDRREIAARAILEAPGPVLVTTSDPGLWAETKDSRAKLGPVRVFDPGHLLDTPDRLRWNPTTGCESRDTAAARAAALLAPVRPLSSLDSLTADTAQTMLRCWLHAAAVDGRAFRQVHRWAQGSSAHEPVRILRTNPKAVGGMAGELESALTGHPERRDMAQELVSRALNSLGSVHIRDACNPHRGDAPALESFIPEMGTLYVVGEAIEDPRTRPGAMPLLTALAASVVERGRGMAERSSSGRLDPPLTLVLEDVAAVAPLPDLPDLLRTGTQLGLPTWAFLRSEEQARARWPQRTLTG
ncbi:type IV secretory system conjugative DNA transfer family protein [Streptomyces orinoci]|uniref:Type IV secretory system conjugative DNA transfer family protein n=1 Tax=Streptomyces orinoci TaxID=67339 RepID=A0ABV3JTF3_STRON|nr:type IV secretory system conjugative DNA transfer family protein [Streptomyces orinoci]